jgi:adenylate cyclase
MSGEHRQLAAVMLTDMVGYSSLTQRDEQLALEVVREQEGIVRPIVGTFGGRIVKTLGDGLLIEFASALEAVRCAVQIQEATRTRNSDADGEPILLRIGVHLGDVVYRDDDVFGDAVNIVARIEPHAEQGGVCVSRQVYDQVHNKLEVTFQSIGSPILKNIEAPIELYKIVLASEHPRPVRDEVPTPSDVSLRRIVVLPFANISPDPDDEYFADGMTEELIEKLAHVSGLRVIARTTAMHYKNSHETALEIGRALGVGMVLECSVRKADKRIRITAQLIETSSEEHLWASRYDRELDDVFAIQDDIAAQITESISSHLSALGEMGSLKVAHAEQDTADMEAYTLFLQGRKLFHDKTSESTIRQALAFFEQAVARDPEFARARVGIAECYMYLGGEGSFPYADSDRKAREELAMALAKNAALAEAHSALAGLMLSEDDLMGAAREARRAVELSPSLSDPYRWLAQLEAGAGNIDACVQLLEDAYRLDPLDINVIAFLGRAYVYAGREAEALAHWDMTESLVTFRTHAHRTEYYLGRQDYLKAEASVGEMERLRPESAWAIMFRGFLAGREGDEETARRCITKLDELDRGGAVTVFLEGFIHFALDEFDAFWEAMEQALELHSLPVLELRYSRLFESARTDPRYDDLLRRQDQLAARPKTTS